VRATRGGACTGRTRLRRSPGGIRREVGDEGWAPSVSLSGRGRSGAAAAVG
jgi:hypothetical protein